MDFIFRMAEKFLKNHNRLMRWRRIFAVLAAVVVFVTTYELILPAITMDKRKAAEAPGVEIRTMDESLEEEGYPDDSLEQDKQYAEGTGMEFPDPAGMTTEETALEEQDPALDPENEQNTNTVEDSSGSPRGAENGSEDAGNETAAGTDDGYPETGSEASEQASPESEIAEKENPAEADAAYGAEEDGSFTESDPTSGIDETGETDQDPDTGTESAAGEAETGKNTDSKSAAGEVETGKDTDSKSAANGEETQADPDKIEPAYELTDETGAALTDDNRADSEMTANGNPAGTENAGVTYPDAANPDPDALAQPGTLTFEDPKGGYTITAAFDETAALPAGTQLSAVEILPGTVYKNENKVPVYAGYEEYYDKTLQALDQADRLGDRMLASTRFFDITFLDADGNPVEPAAPVSIAVKYKDAIEAGADTDTMAIHFDDVAIQDRQKQDKPEIGEAVLIETEQTVTESREKKEIEQVSFTNDRFSVYGVVYTVDFEYEKDGLTYGYSMDGGSSIRLSDIFEALNVEYALHGVPALPESSASVENSTPTENSSFAENSASVEDSESAEDNGSAEDDGSAEDYKSAEDSVSAGHTEGGADSETLTLTGRSLLDAVTGLSFSNPDLIRVTREETDGDWLLESLQPFDTQETLVADIKDGGKIVIEVTDAQPISLKVGETTEFTPDDLQYTGKEGATLYTWTIKSGSSAISISKTSQKTVSITGLKAGSATLQLAHSYYERKNNGDYKSKSTTETKTYAVTVTASEEPATLTEEECTAQEAKAAGFTVAIKETGNLKKLSDYQVVVTDADADYSNVEDMLKAYHIFLADQNGEEVPASELKFKEKDINLQVTLTYTTVPDWFENAENVKHYKNGEEQSINNVKIDQSSHTISFIVHGFSDFVFIRNPGDSGDENSGNESNQTNGEHYAISKTASSTEIENQHEIMLSVTPTIKWGYSMRIDEENIEDLFYRSTMWISNNHNAVEVTEVDADTWSTVFNATNYEDIKSTINSGANGGKLSSTVEEATSTFNKKNGTKYEVQQIEFGDYGIVTLRHPYYVYQSSFSNNDICWVFPELNEDGKGTWMKLTIPGYDAENKRIQFTFGENEAEVIHRKLAHYFFEEDIGNFNNSDAVIYVPTSVTDPMADNITFLGFTGIDEPFGNGNADENSANSSYSSAGYNQNNNTITWNGFQTLPHGSPGYTQEKGTYYLDHSYNLKYEIRLDVQNEGFSSTNPYTMTGESENWYITNGTTTLTAPEGNQTFEVPQVAGILYDLKLKKVDDAGDPVEGAVFAITGSGNNGAVTYGSNGTGDSIQYDKTAASDDNGVVTFSGLPWGTYSIIEVSAPSGYIKDSSTNKSVTLCYTTNPGSLVTSDVNGQTTHLMYGSWENDFKFENRKTHIAVRKIDADDPSALENVSLRLYKKDGDRNKDFYTKTTDENGYAYWDAVPPGEYTLEEANAPSGYVSIPPTEITISEDGSVTVTSPNSSVYIEESQQTQSHNSIDYPLITAKDEPIRIAIKKVDGDGNILTDETATPLAGFSFKINDSDNNYVGTIDGSIGSHPGYFLMEKVPAGTYTLKETAVPTGYKAVADAAVTVNTDGTLSFSHNDLKKTNETIEGKEYRVIEVFNRKSAVKVVLRKTDESGYTCRTENEQIVDTTNYLPGAVFSLKKADGTAVEGAPLEPASDQNGFITSAEGIDLESGTYKLTEDTPPEGYNALPGVVIITVNESGDSRVTARLDQSTMVYHVEKSGTDTYTVYITNNPGVELPHTGGTGFLSPQTLIGIVAMAFVLAAGVMYSFSERRRERRSM